MLSWTSIMSFDLPREPLLLPLRGALRLGREADLDTADRSDSGPSALVGRSGRLSLSLSWGSTTVAVWCLTYLDAAECHDALPVVIPVNNAIHAAAIVFRRSSFMARS